LADGGRGMFYTMQKRGGIIRAGECPGRTCPGEYVQGEMSGCPVCKPSDYLTVYIYNNAHDLSNSFISLDVE